MPGAATFINYGKDAAQQGLQEAQAFNGAGPINNSAAYGSIPSPVYPMSTAPEATAAAIGTGTQVYSQLPGYGQDLATAGSNITSALQGNVPADVQANLAQSAAERGVSTGGGGNAAYLKALGLTSLGLESTGLQEFEGLLPSLPGYSVANNPGFYVTPEQQYQAGVQNSVWASSPDPAAAARASLAATGQGYNTGVGAVRPSPIATPSMPAPSPAFSMAGSTQPSPGGTMTYSNPDNPKTLQNWNDWYSSIVGGTPNPESGSDVGDSGTETSPEEGVDVAG